MSTSQIEEDFFLSIDTNFYQEQISKVIDYFLPLFMKTIRRTMTFNLISLSLIFVEASLSVCFFSYLRESYFLAFWLGFLFLTLFSYFISRSYLLAKRPEQIDDLKQKFIKSCKHLIHYREGIPEHQLALANACCQFDALLKGKEYTVYMPFQWLASFSDSFEIFSCWMHWQDVHQFRESLLQTSIQEHIQLVKSQPINLEAHASLANAYVMLSGLYLDPKTLSDYDQEKWVPPELSGEDMHQKFRKISKKAVEELLILKTYSPHDPWVHTQLALSYCDLKMPQEEIGEYEAILKLCPSDKDTLYKLGTLYFKEGMNAKGLRVYEELRQSNYARAESLIQFYA